MTNKLCWLMENIFHAGGQRDGNYTITKEGKKEREQETVFLAP